MPEKNYTDLANKGWNSMEALLDKEMPVKKDRRWLFLLIFLLLAGLLGGIAYMNRGGSGDAVLDPDKTAYASSKQAEIGEEIQNASKISDESNTEVLRKESSTEFFSASEGSGDEKGANVREIGLSNTAERPAQELESGVNKEVVLNNDKGSQILIDRELEDSLEDQKAAYDSNVVIHQVEEGPGKSNIVDGMAIDKGEGVLNVESTWPPSGKASIPTIEKLDIVSIAILEHKENKFSILSAPLIESKRARNNYVSIYAGYSFPLASQIHGPFLGIDLGKEISRRWTLNASSGLHFISASSLVRFSTLENALIGDPTVEFADPPEILNSADLGEDILVVESNDGRVGLNNEYYDLIAERLGNLTYLDLGLEARYKVTRTLALSFGLKYSYLLTSSTDFIALSEFVPSLAYNAGGLESNVLLSTNLLNRNNFGVNSGLRYQVGKRIGIKAMFNYGLNDIIKIENQSDFRNKLNFLGIGLDYKLYM